MRIAVTGATGFIGRALSAALARAGHEIVVVSRSAEAARRLRPTPVAGVAVWDPAAGAIDAAPLAGCAAVVHLAGESIAGVWTRAKRERIRESRVRGTELIAHTVARLEPRPTVLLSPSGVDYYGDRPAAEPVDEDDPPGHGFLAELCVAWEAATRPAEEAGVRTARMRFGVVLSRRGGMLAPILRLFRLGLGGRVGSGEQPVSWVALADVVAAIRHMIDTPSLAGPVNVVAPGAVTHAEFTRTLGRVLGRPAWFVLPAHIARMLPGGLGDELLLGGARVVPKRLVDSGFRFRYPTLEAALRAELESE